MNTKIYRASMAFIATLLIVSQLSFAQSGGMKAGFIQSFEKDAGTLEIDEKKYRISKRVTILEQDGSKSGTLSLDDIDVGVYVEFRADNAKPAARISAIKPHLL